MAPVALNGSSIGRAVSDRAIRLQGYMVKTLFQAPASGSAAACRGNSAVWALATAKPFGSKAVGLRAARQLRSGFPRGLARPKILTRPSAAVALIFNDNVTEKRSAREKSREHHYDQVPELGRSDFDRY